MGYVGSRVRRSEDLRLVTGRGCYVEDAAPRGTLWLAFVRSPYAHARILRVDASRARQVPGVEAVLTAHDLVGVDCTPLMGLPPGGARPERELLARERVRYAGEPVAAVLAGDRYLAADGAQLVEVEYEPLKVVASAEEAMAPDAPVLHEGSQDNLAFQLRRGSDEVEDALRSCPTVVEVEVSSPRVSAVPMEPRGVVARYDPMVDGLEVWVGTQMPAGSRSALAQLLGLPEGRVRVRVQDMGGGFGSKATLSVEEALVAVLAWQRRCSVGWVETRSESLRSMVHGRGQRSRTRLGLDADGHIRAIDVEFLLDVGAYPHPIVAGPANNAVSMAQGAYRVDHVRARATGVYTNLVPVAPYRGAGRPEGVLAVERAVDEAARRIGVDPAELRRRNFIPAESFPYTTGTGASYDSGDYLAAFEKALGLAGYEHWRREQRRLLGDGRYVGIGICSFVEPAGAFFWESATVRVDPGGGVSLLVGAAPHGQGHQTAFAQVVADELEVPIERVTVQYGDTALVPRGMGTFGSRSAAVAGSSALLASRRVKEMMRRVAAGLLEAPVEDIVVAEGRFHVAGVPGRGCSFAEVAQAAYGGRGLTVAPGQVLEATEYFTLPGMLWPFGTHVAVVEVDADTGEVKVLKYVGVDDCGTVLNPLLVEGQMHGGLAQGFGQALFEELVYDGEGQLLSGSLLDYAVPTAEQVGWGVELGHTVTPSPLNPLGAKGVGEAGAIAAPTAILNAVLDALAPLGVRELAFPLTPHRVWSAIQQARGH